MFVFLVPWPYFGVEVAGGLLVCWYVGWCCISAVLVLVLSWVCVTDLHPSPFRWVPNLCPIFIFPPIEGIYLHHFWLKVSLCSIVMMWMWTDREQEWALGWRLNYDSEGRFNCIYKWKHVTGKVQPSYQGVWHVQRHLWTCTEIGETQWNDAEIYGCYEILFCLKIQFCIHLFMSNFLQCLHAASVTSVTQLHDHIVF